MLNSGKIFRALRDKKYKYYNSSAVRKKFLNETKNHNHPPLSSYMVGPLAHLVLIGGNHQSLLYILLCAW